MFWEIFRQYSTDSQQSGSYLHSNSLKEKKLKQPKLTEKLIEAEKTETGSVSYSLSYLLRNL